MYVRVKNWRKGAQPNRSDADQAGRDEAGSGVGCEADREADREADSGVGGGVGREVGNGAGDQGTDRRDQPVAWPEAGNGTASVPRTQQVRVPRQPLGSGQEAPHPTWEQPDDPVRTHDPNEVTVQLDGVGRQLDDQLVQRAKGDPGDGQDSDGPVFVDESGRRRSRLRRIGILVGAACAVYAVVIVVTLLSGNSSAPWLPVPGPQDDQPAGKVEVPPLPAEPADPSRAENVPSGDSVSPSEDGGAERATPVAGVSAPDTPSAGASAPSASTGPEPSATREAPAPAGPTTKAPVSTPSTPASTTPPPSPSASAEPSPTPTDSPAPDPEPGPGTDTVADGPREPAPLDPGTSGAPDTTGAPVSS
ncbi:hypothetical protein [Streptomyces sp. NPDC002845]